MYPHWGYILGVGAEVHGKRTPAMPLSDAKIRSLKPQERDFKVGDFGGLYLLVKKTGSRSWRFKYRVQGKEKLMVFGDFPHVGLAKARALRDEAKSKLAAGIDPGEEKKTAKRVAEAAIKETFAAVADEYLGKLRAEQKAQATLDKADWLLGMAKADFGTTPVRDITSGTVLQTLRKLEVKGNYETAKRLRSKIGAVFRYAIASGVAENDPTYALRDALIRPKAKPRAAIIEPVRLGELLRAIDGCNAQFLTRIALQLMAILAQRPGELRLAKWDEVDLERAVWTIPAERMKMRRPHQVPLPARAVTILKDLKFVTGTGQYLFPGQARGADTMSENTLNNALRKMGFTKEEMTSHGFRATFATIANESGLWNPDAIERAMAHVDKNAIRRVYARGEYWEERVELAEWWSSYLEECRQKNAAEVQC
jgi:integrase